MSASYKRFTAPSLDCGKMEKKCIFCSNTKNKHKQYTRKKFGINHCHNPGSPENSLKNLRFICKRLLGNTLGTTPGKSDLPRIKERELNQVPVITEASDDPIGSSGARMVLQSCSHLKPACWVIVPLHLWVTGWKLLKGGGNNFGLKAAFWRGAQLWILAANIPIQWGSKCIDPELRMAHIST